MHVQRVDAYVSGTFTDRKCRISGHDHSIDIDVRSMRNAINYARL
jgi:hypothetical protein